MRVEYRRLELSSRSPLLPRPVPLRRRHWPRRLPALPGPVHHGQGGPALVRGGPSGLDHLHALLPGGAASGLPLRSRAVGEPPPPWPADGAPARARPDPGPAPLARPRLALAPHPPRRLDAAPPRAPGGEGPPPPLLPRAPALPR